MAKTTTKPFIWKGPHIGMEEADEIKKLVFDDYIVPQLEASPPLKILKITVATTR